MFDKLIEQIQQAVCTTILTAKDGTEYSTRQMFPVMPTPEPQPKPMEIYTLGGLLGFLASKDWNSKAAAFIHVVSPNHVEVVSCLYGKSKQRDAFCVLKHEPLFGGDFQFGKYFDHETFVVALQTLFAKTPQRDELLQIISSIKTEEILEVADNGISQGVVAKAGVALVRPVTIPSPIVLKPFRTFREIDQPESPFVVRVRKGAPLPQVALFECDGGMWKLEAMEGIVTAIEAYQRSHGTKFELKIIA